MTNAFKRVKLGCYSTAITMSVCGNISPILFLTFRTLYDVSYSLLGFLVLVNFLTQLIVDLIFSFFSHKFNIEKVVKSTPFIAAVGLFVYAFWPYMFPSTAYVGILVGTVIFSAASGLGEVLMSPVIAAIPAKNPEREMSKLHSMYAWGVVAVVAISTLFIFLFGMESWHWLILILMAIPVFATALFFGSELPTLDTPEKTSGTLVHIKNPTLWLCMTAIFLGGAAECTMAQWASGYIEASLGIPKIWGDIFGVAMFSVTLGIGRSLYAKYGRNIEKFLLFGAVGATVCYLAAAISPIPIVGLVACGLTGFFTSMMWPGSLIAVAERIPTGGVFMYAIMAAGGDFGASIAPQLVGVITDGVSAAEFFLPIASSFGITAEQLGMKCGMLVGMLFPLVAILIFSLLLHGKRKIKKSSSLKLEVE